MMNSRLQVLIDHLYPHQQDNRNSSTNNNNGSSFMMNNDQLSLHYTSGSANSSVNNNYTSESSNNRVLYDNSTYRNDGIVLLLLNDPPMNTLSPLLLEALNSQLDKALKDNDCKGIIITTNEMNDKSTIFVAGADITQLKKRQDENGDFFEMTKKANDIMNKIEGSFKPIVSLIHGAALGGGCELIMSTHYRISSLSSSFGLPEINIGIFPGAGGTQRCPRLIGLNKAFEMMMTGQSIKAKEALDLGLVDELINVDKNISSALREKGVDVVKKILNGQLPMKRTLQYAKKLIDPKVSSLKFVENFPLPEVAKLLPHVKYCKQAILDGFDFVSNGQLGLDKETEYFAKCANTPTAKGMIHYFLAQRNTTKLPIKEKPTIQKFTKVGVIGGGTMGNGIAINALENGCQVIVKDINDKQVDLALERIKKVFQSKVERKRLTQQAYEQIIKNLKGQTTYDGFNELELVIEAVLEIKELKQNIFKDLEKYCNDTCIFATNTSTIDLNVIAEKLTNKEKNRKRIVGLHYFAPANVMQLLEIIRTEHTDNVILMNVLNFAKQMKKTPIVVFNVVGFAVNRLFWPYGLAAQYLVERQGLHPYNIDKALAKVIRIGFFSMADMSGLDVVRFAGQSMGSAYSDRNYTDSSLIQLMNDSKRLGEKTGIGFYKYENGKRVPDKDLDQILSKVRKNDITPANYNDKDIVEICLFSAVNEACRVIEEKVVYHVSDIDIASVMGYGFYHYYGGLMKWADSMGSKYVHDRLCQFYKDSGEKLHILKPCNYLKDCAMNNTTLYEH
ncbi:hypothetical protein ABK040_008068 [Willaertia magna]